MSETESEGALRKNIDAVRTIVRTVKSTLGPMGRDKMMVDAGGNSITTNDGATILGELDVSHPGGNFCLTARDYSTRGYTPMWSVKATTMPHEWQWSILMISCQERMKSH